MKNFVIFNPVKIIFGEGEIERIGKEIKNFNAKKVLIVTGKYSSKKTGVLDKVIDLLENEDIKSIIYNNITPNPKVNEVDEASKIGIKESCDFIIGLGGGSAMDAAKGAAITMKNGGSIWDYVFVNNKKSKPFNATIPFALIPTLSATGSEGNPAAVFTNEALKQKSAIYNPYALYPLFSIVDAELTLTVPLKQTMEGIVDIIMHVMEEYLTGEDDCELQDEFSEGIILTCIKNAYILKENLKNITSRKNIALSAVMALHGFSNSGRAGRWVLHPLEHAISGIYDNISHGEGIAALLPSYLKFLENFIPKRIEKLNKKLFNNNKKLYENIKKFLNDIGLKTNLKGLNIKKDDIKVFTEKVIEVSNVPWEKLNKDMIYKIYKEAYE